ncbi:MAG: hypothetical protein U1E14_18800 [Geminicoccaceae bacterium]
MSVTNAAAEQISHLLTVASDAQLLRSMGVVDRLQARGELEQVIDSVRSRLARLRPPRAITLRRIVTLPFADLLVAPERWAAGRQRVSRATLKPLHELIFGDIDAATLAGLEGRAAGRSMHEAEVVLELGRALWPAAAASLRRIVGTPRAARPRWGDDAVEQLVDIIALLDDAPELVPALWQLPTPPMAAFAPEERQVARRLLVDAATRGTGHFRLVVQLLLARAEKPALILSLAGSGDIGLPRRAQEALVHDLATGLVADLDREAGVAVAATGARRVHAAASATCRLAAAVSSLEQAALSLRLPGAAIREIKRKAAALVETELTAAVAGDLVGELAALSGEGRLDNLAVTRLEGAARSARRIGAAGQQLGMGSKIDRILGAARESYRKIALKAVGIAPPPAPGEGPDPVFDHVRIVEILFGPEAAMSLLRELRARR